MPDYLEIMQACAEAAGVVPEEFVQPTDHTGQFGDIELHWLDWGNPNAAPVLLLHGGSLTAHTWDMAVLCLRHKYHFIALDQRGHGDSGWTQESGLAADNGDLMLADTKAFIEHLDLPNLVLVGMSMGGINTIRYVSRYGDHLRAVGIVDVAPVSMQEGQQEMADYRQATDVLANFEDFVDRSKKFMPHRAEAHLRYSLFHSLKQTSDGSYTWKRDHRPRPLEEMSATEMERLRLGREAALWEDVRGIRQPTILFRGEDSKILSPEVASKMVGELPKGQLVTISRATHNVHSDNPVDFAAALDAFLSDLSVQDG
ncbi:MAG: alpha/beta fold hydrolase [Pseudomonadales bacterium]|nr:alpha/beta fold hydrolase [Pseudomonadales bacterium]